MMRFGCDECKLAHIRELSEHFHLKYAHTCLLSIDRHHICIDIFADVFECWKMGKCAELFINILFENKQK